jgi:cytidylate kinase
MNASKYTIQLSGFDIPAFFSYIGHHMKENKHVFEHISVFNISIECDESSTLTPAPGDFSISWDGGEFDISFKEEGKPSGDPPKYFRRLMVSHQDLKTLERFVAYALTWKKTTDSRKIKLYSSSGKGYWDCRESVYSQSFDMIFIPDCVKQQLIDDIDSFTKNKERYVQFGRSYKKTFLLTGVPGSGKTSLAKAVALKYSRAVYALNFTKMMTDESFLMLMEDIKDDSILLIEDIDAFFFERKAQDINVSFSAIINVLDGVLSKGNGLLVFITANNPDRLDPALVRPGRIDKMIKFDYPRKKEVRAAFTKLTGSDEHFQEFYEPIAELKVTMSAIIDFLFRNPDTYLESIQELIDQVKLYNEIVNDKTDKLYT